LDAASQDDEPEPPPLDPLPGPPCLPALSSDPPSSDPCPLPLPLSPPRPCSWLLPLPLPWSSPFFARATPAPNSVTAMPTAITVLSQVVIVVVSFAMRFPAASDPGAFGSGRPSHA